MFDSTYHYPPDLFQLLIDTVARLFRAKKDVLLFFKGAGVPELLLRDMDGRVQSDPRSISKAEIARTILQRINEGGDRTLRERREVVRRVVEFEDFSSCWPDDRLPAQGLVSRVQAVVDMKDSFTRMKQEKEKEQREHRERKEAEALRARLRREEFDTLKKQLYALFSHSSPRQRGLEFEVLLNRLFSHYGILVRDSFSRYGEVGEGVIEQIDGAVELDGGIYLVEVKWLRGSVNVDDVSRHIGRVIGKHFKRGIIISGTDFTEPAMTLCRESSSTVLMALVKLSEIVTVLEQESDLKELLRSRINSAAIGNSQYGK